MTVIGSLMAYYIVAGGIQQQVINLNVYSKLRGRVYAAENYIQIMTIIGNYFSRTMDPMTCSGNAIQVKVVISTQWCCQ